jgi:hypothetical protein
MSGGYSASLSLHSNNVPAGTNLVVGVRQPTTEFQSAGGRRKSSCPSTVTIPLYNPFWFAIVLDIDGFSIGLPCSVDGTLFGVSFYQVKPVPATISSLKVGDITATGNKITFSSDVTSITLPAHTETALTITPEGSTSEVAIPVAPGGSTMLTSNASGVDSTLSFVYSSTTGGGSLFSSGCYPAYTGGVLAPGLAGVPILGKPSYYCQLGTVDSPTIGFGTTVTFTIGAPLPDRSFVGLDGPAAEYLCTTTGATTCTTPAFTVPTVQNVIAGNVEDLQICFPKKENQGCNTNPLPATSPSPSPAPTASAVPSWSEIQLLVADDPTYTQPVPGTCPAAPALCGSFQLTTSGSCVIDNGEDENGDVPPGYNDPGGPQESPPVWKGTSTTALFPAQGPFVEFDLDTTGPGVCTATVTETNGPLLRSSSATVNVVNGAAPQLRPSSATSDPL